TVSFVVGCAVYLIFQNEEPRRSVCSPRADHSHRALTHVFFGAGNSFSDEVERIARETLSGDPQSLVPAANQRKGERLPLRSNLSIVQSNRRAHVHPNAIEVNVKLVLRPARS